MSTNAPAHLPPQPLAHTPTGPDYKFAFEQAADSRAIIDRDGQIVAISDGYLVRLCRGRSEVIGHPASRVLRLQVYDHVAFAASLREALAHNQPTRCALRHFWPPTPTPTPHAGATVEARQTPLPCEDLEPHFVLHRVVDGDADNHHVAAGPRAMVRASSRISNAERLSGELANQRRRTAFLAGASRQLVDSLDYNTTLQRIARLALPELADMCVVDVVDAHRRIKREQVAHVCAQREHEANVLFDHVPAWDDVEPSAQVLRHGRPWLAEAVTPRLLHRARLSPARHAAVSALGLTTAMAVPMSAHGRTLGVIFLGRVHPGHSFTIDDLACAQGMAERAAFALENARLYRDAQAALTCRDDFLLLAAHELRTPLTTLMLHLHAAHRHVSRALAGRPEQRASAERLRRSIKQGERIDHILDALLDVACISHGQFTINLTKVDFARVVHGVLGQLKASGDIARSHCELQVAVPERICGLWDGKRLEQLAHHLLTNALKYGAGQPVRICLEERAQAVVLCVQDHGIGIALQAQERIFERFGRAASTYNYGGLGVGLYVVQQIALALGGHITVESTPGGGATFEVILPRRCACTPPTWPAPPCRAPAL